MDFTLDLEMSPLEVALLGAEQLASLTFASGRFKYRYDAETGQRHKGYNVLRHCGAIWSMLDVNESKLTKTEVGEASARATVYLQNEFVRFFKRQDRLCILEDNSVKLGGIGLAILAMLAQNKNAPDQILTITIERLGQYILADQDDDGDFIHKRFFKSEKVSAFRSGYYTGEALLALLALYESTKDKVWLDAVIKCEDYLCPQNYGVAEQSHWMLYALEKLCIHQPNDEYYKHSCDIARHILDHPAYRESGRSTPLACRSEGLLAFLRTTPTSKAVEDENLRERCLEVVKENLALQIEFRTADGAFIRGGGDRRHNEVRIDYTQHNISSFLQYSRLADQQA